MNKNSKIKCNKCNGSGFVPIGPGIRGLKKCPECNGTGNVAYIVTDEFIGDLSTYRVEKAIRICEMAIGEILDANGNNVHVYNDELRHAIKIILQDREKIKNENEKAKYTEKVQKGNSYTFYKNENETELIKQFNWCQRPDSTNMSLCRFNENAEVCGFMSESFAERNGLKWISLNEFIHNFVKVVLKENIKLKEENQNLSKGR